MITQLTPWPEPAEAPPWTDSASTAMEHLKTRLAAILDLIPPGSRIALIDEPVIRNIGDHLIHAGTERFFADHQVAVVYRASQWSYSRGAAHRRLDAGAKIVLTGGGSLGDLYPRHQQLREKVVRDFPDHRIVVLPQSIRFEDPTALERAARVFRGHRDLHLLVRERPSEDFARTHLAQNVRLLPDMAHWLWPIRPPASNREPTGVLFLMRRDEEQSHVPEAIASHAAEFTDWGDHVGRRAGAAVGLCAALGLAGLRPGRVFLRMSERLVRIGIDLVGRHSAVVTSRLHGHILALLLKKPNLVLDNSYGKVAAYHREWTASIDACRGAKA